MKTFMHSARAREICGDAFSGAFWPRRSSPNLGPLLIPRQPRPQLLPVQSTHHLHPATGPIRLQGGQERFTSRFGVLIH